MSDKNTYTEYAVAFMMNDGTIFVNDDDLCKSYEEASEFIWEGGVYDFVVRREVTYWEVASPPELMS